MKKIFTLILACALVMSANAVPSLKKSDAATAQKQAQLLEQIRSEIANQTVKGKSLKAQARKVAAAKDDAAWGTVGAAQAVYYDGTWELDMFSSNDANATLAGIVGYEGGDETHLVASNIEIDGETNFLSIVRAPGDTVDAISGTLNVSYDHSEAGIPYYHLTGVDVLSNDEPIDVDLIFPVQYAIDYLYYMYAYYGYDVDYMITLADAPVELTGETINVVIEGLIWNDQVADYGFWQAYGYSADSTYYISLSNGDDVEEANGTYALADMDMDYTYFYIGEEEIKIHDLNITVVADDAAGTATITGTLVGRNGVVYNLTLGAAPKVIIPSDNVITLNYVNGAVLVNTTNNDLYFFKIESKDSYDSYQDDFSQASVNNELEGWIYTYAQYGYLSYFTFAGNQSFPVAEEFSSAPESGEYVALAAGINSDGDLTTDGVYLLFNYNVGDAVENVTIENAAVKRIENGVLVIERNGKLFNANGVEIRR